MRTALRRLFVALFLLSYATIAGAQALPATALELRAKLEREVQGNLEKLIATRLDAKTFSVAVNARVIEAADPEKPKKKPEASAVPLGMDLGTINVHDLMDSYERELARLREKAEKDKKKEPQFQIKSIEVSVGLDERYPDDYLKEFTSWLNTKMKREYGTAASVQVGRLHVLKTPEAEKPKEPEKPQPTWFDYLKDLQYLLGYALLAAAILLGFFLIRGALKKIATEQKSLALEPRGEWQVKTTAELLPQPESEAELLDDRYAAERIANPEELDRQGAKIAFLCLELQGKINDLVRVWMDSGDEGLLKTALLIDTLVSAREKFLSRAGAIPALQIPLDQDLVANREEQLSEAYRRVTDMELQDRLDHLERVYWDLVSVRTLGLQSLRRPFDFLTGLENEEVKAVLATQKREARALALIYMDSEQKSETIASLEAEEKENLLRDMLAFSQVSQREIWDTDTAVKVSAMNQSEQPKEKLVNLFPRTLEALQSLSAMDEIKILRKVTPSLPDNGRSLKVQYATLAFIDQWKPDYIRKLAQVATSDEVTALCYSIPQAKEALLDECPPKIRTIVEDDLSLTATPDPVSIEQRLASLKKKWNRVIVSEKIQLSRVIQKDAEPGETAYAA